MLLHHRKTRSGRKVYVEIFSYLAVITAVERSSGVCGVCVCASMYAVAAYAKTSSLLRCANL